MGENQKIKTFLRFFVSPVFYRPVMGNPIALSRDNKTN